ncbi:MAG: tripartite tricarboxylate transporter TctB family protein [Beijerinckiaceae bacterium]|nr:tripartite tricarboxylate transporter TctB family protein [Beijerinckiaceae bacterium]MCZ8300053.1 tripartite tricarboxylate transporter TctB family protein [Beijerinckiaceae bacterium]
MLKPSLPELLVGLGMVGFAVVVGFATAAIPSSAYAKVGPAVVPWAITAGLVFFGLLLTFQGLTGGWEHERGVDFDWRGLGWLLAGLVMNLLLIDGYNIGETKVIPQFGFIIASTVVFSFTARAFGSRAFLRDALIGFVLALVAYIGFDRVLGYQIGSGMIERLI